jgi:hypothetical protein
MAVIGRSVCLALVCAAALLADTHDDIVDRFAAMAAALADNNAAGFMAGVAKSMPDYDRLQAQVESLVGLAMVASDIDPQRDTGDDRQRSVDLDWFLSLRSKQPDGPTVQRRQLIHVDLRKEGKHWKIVAIAPLDFFAPPDFTK